MNQREDQPIPQGNYLPAVRNADLIYTSGMTPRKSGELMFCGKIETGVPIENYRDAVCLATSNALIAAQACLKKEERIAVILQLTVYLNTETDFTLHAKVADYASTHLVESLGNACVGSRAAIGVASLPSNAPVEITLVAKVDSAGGSPL